MFLAQSALVLSFLSLSLLKLVPKLLILWSPKDGKEVYFACECFDSGFATKQLIEAHLGVHETYADRSVRCQGFIKALQIRR